MPPTMVLGVSATTGGERNFGSKHEGGRVGRVVTYPFVNDAPATRMTAASELAGGIEDVEVGGSR